MAPTEPSRHYTAPSFPKPAGEHWIEGLDNGTHGLIRRHPQVTVREMALA